MSTFAANAFKPTTLPQWPEENENAYIRNGYSEYGLPHCIRVPNRKVTTRCVSSFQRAVPRADCFSTSHAALQSRPPTIAPPALCHWSKRRAPWCRTGSGCRNLWPPNPAPACHPPASLSIRVYDKAIWLRGRAVISCNSDRAEAVPCGVTSWSFPSGINDDTFFRGMVPVSGTTPPRWPMRFWCLSDRTVPGILVHRGNVPCPGRLLQSLGPAITGWSWPEGVTAVPVPGGQKKGIYRFPVPPPPPPSPPPPRP